MPLDNKLKMIIHIQSIFFGDYNVQVAEWYIIRLRISRSQVQASLLAIFPFFISYQSVRKKMLAVVRIELTIYRSTVKRHTIWPLGQMIFGTQNFEGVNSSNLPYYLRALLPLGSWIRVKITNHYGLRF